MSLEVEPRGATPFYHGGIIEAIAFVPRLAQGNRRKLKAPSANKDGGIQGSIAHVANEHFNRVEGAARHRGFGRKDICEAFHIDDGGTATVRVIEDRVGYIVGVGT